MNDPEALDDEDFYSDMLGNLLAIIHSDGGHYRLRHGTTKATDDAMEIVTDLRVKLDSQTYQLRQALKEYGRHKSNCGGTKPDDHVYHPCTCGFDSAFSGESKP